MSRRTPVLLCAAGTAWAAAWVVAIWSVPLYTVDSGVSGPQPRVPLSRAAAAGLGDGAGSPLWGIALFCTCLLLAVAAMTLTLVATRRRDRRLAAAAVTVAAGLFLVAGAGFVTIFVGAYEVPGAALLLAGASLARGWVATGSSPADRISG